MIQNMSISDLVYILLVCFSFAITVVNLILNKMKTGKERKRAKTELDEKIVESEEFQEQLTDQQNLYKITSEYIPQAIKLAESNNNISGCAKKLIAVSDVIQRCAMDGIEYKNYANVVNEEIESLVQLTNEVNVNK